MFQLTKDKAENLRSQIATLNSRSQNVILKDNLGNWRRITHVPYWNIW